MAKPEWGTKRTCTSCAAKYYDFQRDPIICPKCGDKFVVATTVRARRSRSARPEPVAEKPAVTAKEEDPTAAETEDVDADDADVILDDSDDLDDDLISVDADNDSDEKEA